MLNIYHRSLNNIEDCITDVANTQALIEKNLSEMKQLISSLRFVVTPPDSESFVLLSFSCLLIIIVLEGLNSKLMQSVLYLS